MVTPTSELLALSAEMASLLQDADEDESLSEVSNELWRILVGFQTIAEARPSLSAQAVGDDDPLHELFADLRLRFKSGNAVPVERAHITADEFRRILSGFSNWSTVRTATPPQPADGGDRVGELVEAAHKYAFHYARDEASIDGDEITGCSKQQHLDAVALFAALAKFQPAGGENNGR